MEKCKQVISSIHRGYIIPRCLTPIPPCDFSVGLIGRDDIKECIFEIWEKGNFPILLFGQPGIGKTEIMKHVCNETAYSERKMTIREYVANLCISGYF